MSEHVEVLIIGAGISGIGAAYHLQTSCPNKSYAILERRAQLGGTWDLFRYPGIRSDSDMYTLGYSFRPWTGENPIAEGESILSYLRDTAAEYGIDAHIRHGQSVESARWSSQDSRWTLGVRDEASGELRELSCNFLWGCAGYYDYEAGHTPAFPELDSFEGTVVHPQHWPEALDYADKQVVVIGSGATAVTLVPALAKRAAHVTMLQRSPSYVLSMPARDQLMAWLDGRLSPETTYTLTRWKSIMQSQAFYWFCRWQPERAKAMIVGEARRQLGEGFDVDTHFNPSYAPWDQRLCVAPGGDLFATLASERASVVTDHIEHFTPTGLKLRSGETLDADIVVTATGLRLCFMGGIELEVDGAKVRPNETLAYRGMMLGGVPNLAMCIGYINASWTLKVDLTCEYVCRMLNYMDAEGYALCCPRSRPEHESDRPLMDFNAGYIARSKHLFPRQGTQPPWRVRQNYLRDLVSTRRAQFPDEGMHFARGRA